MLCCSVHLWQMAGSFEVLNMTRDELEQLWRYLMYQSGEPLKDGLAVTVNNKSDESAYEKLHRTMHSADL